ncbi:hypothetical protein CGC21_15685 [Leishmania donovani]|uniref:Uncharacterized protein n=1 Tax=Leishmania donovani TaxID=5661 RepID=A0A504XT02_LEIDO|nr:hypothetical protein CGC21_15685 [Leishmania donovani]
MRLANELGNVEETFLSQTSVILKLHHEADKVPLTPQRRESGFWTHSSDQESLTKREEATGVEGALALTDVKTWGGTYTDLSGKTAESVLAQEITQGPDSAS